MRIVAIAVLAVAIAVIGFRLISGGDDGDDNGGTEARIVSADELQELAQESGQEVYWAGVRPGTQIEFSEPDEGVVQVRYLTGDAPAGDPSESFLAIGTYDVGNPVERLLVTAARPGSVRHNLPGGGLIVATKDSPRNAYLGEAGSASQVEIYSPKPAEALGLALTGAVVPVP